MNWWPGWNSIEGAGWWSGFYFWFGIVALFVLGITEVISHRYGLRKDELVSVAERNAVQDRATKDRQTEADAAKMRQELAEAKKAAADSGKTASTVAEQATPRHLSATQEQAIFNAIAPFRGNKIDIVVQLGNSEAMNFAEEFVAIFRRAGWDAGKNGGISQTVYGGEPPQGVQVMLNEGEYKAGHLPNGAVALVRALDASGLAPQGFLNPQIPAGQIQLRVGTK